MNIPIGFKFQVCTLAIITLNWLFLEYVESKTEKNFLQMWMQNTLQEAYLKRFNK